MYAKMPNPKITQKSSKMVLWEFPGSLVVKILECSVTKNLGSIPDLGTNIPKLHGQKENSLIRDIQCSEKGVQNCVKEELINKWVPI